MCNGTYYDENTGNYTNRIWITPFFNYNNIPMITFFSIST